MGAVASATYAAGGRVLGIIPRALMSYERSAAETGSDELEDRIKRPTLADQATEEDKSLVIPVKTMHERKQWVPESKCRN
jgi:predicted Rossmann-fold nucleotide-binding protein